MTNSDAPEQDFDPRHRIVGAIIIVTLAIIVVPLILDKNEWQPKQPGKQVAAPPADTRVVVTRVEDLRRKNKSATSPDATKKAEDAAVIKKSADEAVAQPKQQQADKKVLITKKTESAATLEARPARQSSSKPVAANPTSTASEGWVVQIGTFANKANVERMRTQLSSKGYKVSTQVVQLASGPATRVRVGPYGRKTQADTMRKRIESDLGLKGSVLAVK